MKHAAKYATLKRNWYKGEVKIRSKQALFPSQTVRTERGESPHNLIAFSAAPSRLTILYCLHKGQN